MSSSSSSAGASSSSLTSALSEPGWAKRPAGVDELGQRAEGMIGIERNRLEKRAREREDIAFAASMDNLSVGEEKPLKRAVTTSAAAFAAAADLFEPRFRKPPSGKSDKSGKKGGRRRRQRKTKKNRKSKRRQSRRQRR